MSARRILVFGAHPDDAEIGMSGTIVKHAAAGDEVGICDLTLAELSSNGDVETRRREAEKAAQILGLSYRSNLELPDRGLKLSDDAAISAIVGEIRRRRPAIIFAPYWQDRHPDHIACSQLVQEAVFNAKLRKYRPETEAWETPQVYYYFINDTVKPDLIVDTSNEFAIKRQALQAYRSQFTAGEGNVETPLNRRYVERVEARDSLLAQSVKADYAEGFMTKTPYLIHTF